MIDVGEIVVGGVGIVSTVVSSWISWFLTKRKYNSEVDQTLIENMEKSLDFYTKLADDNSQRLDKMTDENDKLRDELMDLRRQMSDLVFNICLDLTCQNRVREGSLFRRRNAKNSDRLDITENCHRGGREPSGTE